MTCRFRYLIIVNDVAEVCEGVSEVDSRVFLALAVLVGVRVAEVPLEVRVGDGVSANRAPAARVFELFA